MNEDTSRYQWSKLNNLQKGMYGEYVAKMEFAMYGFLVFSAEVDDRGIDFVARRSSDGKHFDVQVKSITGTNYPFIPESKFTSGVLLCLVVLKDGEPPLSYIFSRPDWDDETKVDGLLKFRKYPNAKESEYGIHLAKKRQSILQLFDFDKRIAILPA